MSKRIGWGQAYIVGAVLSGAALVSTNALAQSVGPVPTAPGCCEGGSATGANAWSSGNYTSVDWPSNPAPAPATGIVIGKAPPPPADTGWWTHGELEVGYRDFTTDPARNGSGAQNSNVWQQGQNLAKYYEYSDIAPGAFGGGHIATGTNDGLYQIDLWANNVGYNDQSYLLSASKAGEQYLTVIWDQTPHLYSTTAQTPYNFSGPYSLTVPAQTATTAALVPFMHRTDIGIHRDTAEGTYRWTPTEAWDFNVDYSHMTRDGTQSLGGVVGIPSTGATTATNYAMVLTPVHDSTQNYSANGEYAGTSPWGQNFTVKLGYRGSTYSDGSTSYTIENPLTGAGAGLLARESMWPSNQANGFVSAVAVDLPAQSRYVGSVNYTSMTQNSAFQPMSANFTGTAPSVNPLPASSLNGDINTLLSNNVLTTKITPELTNKLTYRYYDFDNQTPQILFTQWLSYDGAPPGSAFEGAFQSLTMKYIKQDASESLNWRPSQYWNFNAGYNYERYDYHEADVSATNENSAKISADYKPFTWLTARSSASYGYRTYENYNYAGNVWNSQIPVAATLGPVCGLTGTAACVQDTFGYASAYRQFMFDNRQQTRGQLALDIVAFPRVTVSPTIKYQDDYYGINPTYEYGIDDRKSLSFGVDTSYVANSQLTWVFAYYQEYGFMSMDGGNTGHGATCLPGGAPLGCGPGSVGTTAYTANDKATVNTISAGSVWSAIPDRLDIDLRVALTKGRDQEDLWQYGPGIATPFPTGGQYPADTTWFTHLDATAIYKFDPTFVSSLGWKGDLKFKLRYTWELNSVQNWQNAGVLPFSATQGANYLLLASDNPNYNIQMVAASFVATW
jgi:MtrB/PioB family decaheme-associated outer membrane protein